MKLPIKKEFFDQIKSGKKKFEYRDAHITFVCEETGEKIKREIYEVQLIRREKLPNNLKKRSDLFKDFCMLKFKISN